MHWRICHYTLEVQHLTFRIVKHPKVHQMNKHIDIESSDIIAWATKSYNLKVS